MQNRYYGHRINQNHTGWWCVSNKLNAENGYKPEGEGLSLSAGLGILVFIIDILQSFLPAAKEEETAFIAVSLPGLAVLRQRKDQTLRQTQ